MGGLTTTGHRADYERGTISRVATDEDVLGILRMFRLQESHSQQTELGLDNLGLALLDHDGATAFWVWLPVNLLNLYASQFAVLAQKLQGVDIPATGATLLVT